MFFAASVFSMTTMAASVCYTDYVNPWVGTGGHGHVFLGANVPFGYVQLGPTERNQGWDWCSGYHYSDSVLVGFGHQHLSGTGIGDLGDVAFLPVTDSGQTMVKFSHSQETIFPGYYAVKLQDPNVFVELTATKRAGFHRYTFGGNMEKAMLVIDLVQGIGWDTAKDYVLMQESSTQLSGHRFSKGWANDQKVYFVADFSQAVTMKPTGKGKWLVEAEDVTKPLLVKVGLSAVSVDNAKENLSTEIPAWNFNGTVAQAKDEWNKELSKIQIETTDSVSREIFYTALFHTMTAPSVFSDVNGEYRGSDGKSHKGDFVNYTTFSLWDTYRAAQPLMTLIHQDMMPDMVSTFVNIYREQGKLPVWHLMGNETDCMVGNPGVIALADMVLKGFVKDKETAFEAMKNSAMLDERGMGLLKQYGYIPYDKHPEMESTAKGLEYAIADACIAQVAKALGKKVDAKYFENRSKAYAKYFDPKSRFMRGLGSDGKFREPFSPFKSIHRQDDYTEGNAWQYTWLVPHDVHGLVKLFGNEKAFTAKLDSLFIVDGDLGDQASPDVSGLIGQYAHGNEPSHHILYIYNYVGQPWKGARLIRQTLEEMYKADYDGLSGNEDVGQMSAWYVLSSMGIYQVEPAGGKFVIGTPIFDSASMKVGGKTFTVKTLDNSKDNIYVQSARLNGKPYTKSYIMYSDLVKGGILELQMGSKPSSWGTKVKDRP